MSILIKGALVIDPCEGINGVCDVLIERGTIKEIGRDIPSNKAKEVIEGKGKILAPGFVDLHVHLRDPGQTYKEDIESGSRCAVAGGFTTIVCMPNTVPAIDRREVVEYIVDKAKSIGLCEVLPAGAVTEGRKGKKLVNMYSLLKAGCVTFSDDGSPVQDPLVMKRAMQIADQLGTFIMNHCEDDRLASGHINDGLVHTLTGILPRYTEAEDIMIARDCILSLKTGAHVHIQHVSSALAVEIIRFFKEKGAKITAEVNPHHLILTEKSLLEKGSLSKVNPPLRREEDREALIRGIREGIIDCIATDHAPHSDKEKGFIESALPGIIGLQTALPIMLDIHRKGFIDMKDIIRLMSCNPAKILGREHGIKIGKEANLVLFDPEEEWVLDEKTNLSKSKNTPLWGEKLKGKVKLTIFKGKRVYEEF